MIDTFLRNKRVAIILVIIIAFLVFIDYKTPFFDVLMSNKKYDEILTFTETIIAFSSITTAFLFFGVSFIPMISDDNKIMKVFRNNEKNYEEFIVCAIQFLMVSTISILFYLLYMVGSLGIKILLYSMLALLFSSIINMTILFIDLLKDISKKIEN